MALRSETDLVDNYAMYGGMIFGLVYFSELVSSALDGMQPTFRHVRPSRILFSIQAVFRPKLGRANSGPHSRRGRNQ